MDCSWIFHVAALLCSAAVKAAATPLIEITASEGENVTLVTGVDNTMHVILSCNNNILLNLEEGNAVRKIKKIDLDMKKGTVAMLNVQKEDSKVCHLQIDHSDHRRDTTDIRLNITEHQGSDVLSPKPTPRSNSALPNQRGRLGVYISVSAVAVTVAVIVAIALFLRQKRVPNSSAPSTGQATHCTSCCINVDAADSSGSTSRSDSMVNQEDPLMASKQT